MCVIICETVFIAVHFNNIHVSSLKTAIASEHLAANWYCNTHYIV